MCDNSNIESWQGDKTTGGRLQARFPLPAFIYRVSVRDTLPGIGRADRGRACTAVP